MSEQKEATCGEQLILSNMTGIEYENIKTCQEIIRIVM